MAIIYECLCIRQFTKFDFTGNRILLYCEILRAVLSEKTLCSNHIDFDFHRQSIFISHRNECHCYRSCTCTFWIKRVFPYTHDNSTLVSKHRNQCAMGSKWNFIMSIICTSIFLGFGNAWRICMWNNYGAFIC